MVILEAVAVQLEEVLEATTEYVPAGKFEMVYTNPAETLPLTGV